jgi:hypothetical protein
MNLNIKYLKVNFREIILLFILTIPLFVYSIEVFTYQGFVAKKIILSNQQLLYLSLIVNTILISNPMNIIQDYYKYIIRIIMGLLIVFVLLFFCLGYLEEVNYPNYVFTKFHVDFQNISPLISYNFYLVLIILIKKEMDFKKLKIKNLLSRFIAFTTFFLLSLYLINNLHSVLSLANRNISFILANPTATYDEKMTKKMGFFYEYMQFIKENTPGDAVIHLPPKIDPWQMTGNAGLVRYFLYPRKLVSTGDPYILSENDYDYIMISKGFFNQAGDWGHGWPKISVEAEKILYLDPEIKNIKEVFKDYDPDDSENEGAWGLIKIDKDRIITSQ